jgi:hypothetical protein
MFGESGASDLGQRQLHKWRKRDVFWTATLLGNFNRRTTLPSLLLLGFERADWLGPVLLIVGSVISVVAVGVSSFSDT